MNEEIKLSDLNEIFFDDSLRIKNAISQSERFLPIEFIPALESILSWTSPLIFFEKLSEKNIPLSKSKEILEILVKESFILIKGSDKEKKEILIMSNLLGSRQSKIFQLNKRNIQFCNEIEEVKKLRNILKSKKDEIKLFETNKDTNFSVKLPNIDKEDSILKLISSRRTRRTFHIDRYIKLKIFSDILWSTFGINDYLNLPGRPIFPLRNTASFGGLNSVIPIIWANRINELDKGWYEYSGSLHALSKLDFKSLKKEKYIFSDQMAFKESSFLIFLVHKTKRSSWKYNDSSTYDASLIEAGQLVQNLVFNGNRKGISFVQTNSINYNLLYQYIPEYFINQNPILIVIAGGIYDNSRVDDYSPKALKILLSLTNE